jgi:hypothetical protein
VATQHKRTNRARLPLSAPTAATNRDALKYYRERKAARKRARLTGSRHRRAIARWLRRTARHSPKPHPLARRRETLLHYRVALVRAELLEVAAILEHTPNPDPACIGELHELLANGCDSPLYNPDIHASELQATLHHIRDLLTAPISHDQPHPT